MATILVVDDDAVTCRLVAEVLAGEGVTIIGETDPRRALARATEQPVHLAILDVQMPQMNGLALLRDLRERFPELPVIVMTAFGSIDTAVEAIGSGAIDYVSKPMDVEELRATARRALDREGEAQARLPAASDELGGVIGRSTAMVDVYKTIARVAPGRSTVLILGESGTGKELVARAIHRHGPRRKQPFVAVDCGALTETLLESELFGHVRGAFTDAKTDRTGAFELADGGTLFLDEVGNMPMAQQAKLLRVLQTGEFNPVGSSKVRKADVRVVAATNARLADEVGQGRFREDLLYRLNTVEIHLPPLRERGEDIPHLAQHFLTQQAAKYGKALKGFQPDALEALVRHPWTGNVRELEHAVERSVLMARGDRIAAEDLFLSPAARRDSGQLYESMTLDEAERHLIQRALSRCAGNVSEAARELGVSRSALYRRLQHHGLKAQG